MCFDQTSPCHDLGQELRDAYIASGRDEQFGLVFDGLLRTDGDGQVLPMPRHFTDTQETRGVMVVAKSGAGKTRMISRALARHPALQPDETRLRPWIMARVPSPATTKGLGIAILEATDYPCSGTKRVEREIWSMVRHRLAELGTIALWIDEAQDLFGKKDASETRNILNLLKAQMQGEGSVIVILSGVEELQQIAATDRQITRRFKKMHLQDISAGTDNAMLRGIVESYCRKAGLGAPTFADELLGRMVHAAQSRLGQFIENLLNAIEIALDEGATALDRGHFIEAHAAETGCTPTDNVYMSSNWSRVDLDRVPAL
ncbi:TniB family NTP-binding protein [Tropicibacter oceani]|uniref:TniB family NTP-binding protein n=1 Tax=Tropicibacter oceani TaxID=3058420 RepID=A0ABY8QKX7_9RHOB|nr:TniB family NTP-binding protein [Tropicibacter oceani]WGW05098.1 TniB family NTP-binding protein [Tropicibacter oceani]